MGKKYKVDIGGETFYADASTIDVVYELVLLLEQQQKNEEKLAAFKKEYKLS